MRRGALILLALLACAAPSWAAPAITSISGTPTHGQAVTITGTGFGTKSPAKPIIWADFEGGTITSDPNLSTGTLQSKWVDITTDNDSSLHSTYAVGLAPNSTVNGYRTGRLFVDAGEQSTPYWYVKRNYDHANWWSYDHDSDGFPTAGKYSRQYLSCTTGLPQATFIVDNTAYPSQGLRMLFQPQTTGAVSYFTPGPPPTSQQWHIEEYALTAGTVDVVDAIARHWIDGVVIHDRLFKARDTANPGIWKCFDIENYLSGALPPPDAFVYMDNYYVDRTWARAMLGNASTWTASTQREIQIPTAWSDTSVEVSFNQGTFANGTTAYLYVVDSTGAVNATGHSVVVGATTNLVVTPGIQAAPYNFYGPRGGPFASIGATLIVTNAGTGSMNWTASSSQSWVTLSSTGGTLGSGAEATITMTPAVAANALAGEIYSSTITFTNTTDGTGNTTRTVKLVATGRGLGSVR